MGTQISYAITALETERDNAFARGENGHVSEERAGQLLHRGFDMSGGVMHDPHIDARMGDDLRKLSVATARFRQACVEFSVNRYAKHDPNDPQRWQRLHRQMVETARDMRSIMSHIDADCGGR